MGSLGSKEIILFLWISVNFLLSRSGTGRSEGKDSKSELMITAAATKGPAKEPRPHSSKPQIFIEVIVSENWISNDAKGLINQTPTRKGRKTLPLRETKKEPLGGGAGKINGGEILFLRKDR